MMEALGSMAITGSTLFGYNRKNFMYDRKMRQEQEFTIAEMRLRVADLWREDVRDVTELTERKMDTYMVVNVLQLGFSVTLFIEGRLESGTPQWLLWLYMCTLSGAFMFLLLSVWMAMHASVVTQSSAVRLLTQLVRPPVPSWEQLESMRTYASSFEAVNTFQMFRVPVLQTLKEGRQAGAGGFSGSAEAEPGSVAADPWGLERRGDDLYELSRRPPAAARHVRLLQEASKHWRAYDAFARVTMTMGTILLCQALGYFCQGYLLINDGAVWASWTVMGIMLAIASAVLRLDVSMTKSEYRQTQAVLLIGPSLSCVVGAAWATWEVKVQRYAWILLPPAFICHALFLISFLRVCRVVEQPCGSILPLSFRSVLYLDVFGWLTKSGKVKVASGPSARCLKPTDPEYDSGPLITCKDVCDVLPKPGECLLPDVTQEAKLDAKDKQTVRQVSKMLSSFSSGAVQEHLDATERITVRRLSQRLGEIDPDVRGVDSAGQTERSADWVQLSTYSDCGRKVPYYVHVDSGKVSHAAPPVTPDPSPVSELSNGGASSGQDGSGPVGLLPSLSFAEQQVEALASKAQNALPNGPPVSFAPPTSDRLDRKSSGTPGIDPSPANSFFGSGLAASDVAGVGSACSAASGGQSSRRLSKLRSRRASYKAVHGQNFPRYFAKTGAPKCLRPEDADSFAASPSNRIGSSSCSNSAGKYVPSADSDVDLADDVDQEEAEEEEDEDELSPGGMQGIGPVGVVPEASADTFDPTSFAPEAGHHHRHHHERRNSSDIAGHADSSGGHQTSTPYATGRDLFKPGQLPWYTFRSAVRLLSGLFLLGSLWSTLQSLGIPDIPDYVLPTSVHVSGDRRGERSDDGMAKSLYEDLLAKEEALPPGQRVLAQWPSPRFQPRGLSADPEGRVLVISDEFDIYIASYTEEPSPTGAALVDASDRRLHGEGHGHAPKVETTGWLEQFRQLPNCAALEGQAIRDVALVCRGPDGTVEGASKHEGEQASGCTVMVLHSRGERVASCTAEADGHNRRLDEDDEEDEKKASNSNNWRVSGKWLRDLGQPSIQEQVLSIVVDPDCQTPENLHERDSCMVIGTSHGRVIALRPHLEIRSELVPARALWNVLGRAAVAEKVHGLATSLMTAIPGGFVLSLRQEQRKLQAIDVVRRRVWGKWTLPSHIGRKWTALAGGATHIFLSSQGGACADAPARWVDSKGYSCQDYAEKRWCTADGKYGNGWDSFWGGVDRFVNSKHTAMTACCACGGGDREDEGSTSQIWKFPLPEDLRAEVALRLKAVAEGGELEPAEAAD